MDGEEFQLNPIYDLLISLRGKKLIFMRSLHKHKSEKLQQQKPQNPEKEVPQTNKQTNKNHISRS